MLSPITPLPWDSPGTDGGAGVISYQDAHRKRRTIAHVYGDSPRAVNENRAYVAHTANAYPQLVAALQDTVAAWDAIYAHLPQSAEDAEFGALLRARTLLRSLGEEI